MENLTCELNGIKYLLVECPVYYWNKDKIDARCKRHGVIQQGVSRIVRGGFLSSGYLIIKLLVPEKNIMAWENDDN